VRAIAALLTGWRENGESVLGADCHLRGELLRIMPELDRNDQVSARITWGPEHHRVRYLFPNASLDSAGDAFLAAMLLPAMRAGEALEIRGQVSPRLLAATTRLQEIFLTWDRYHRWAGGRLSSIQVRADERQPSRRSGRGIGCFFSGGIDSFYSVLKHRDEITHLIFVHGWDIEIGHSARLALVSAALREAAAELGKPLLEVRTDIRSFCDPLFPRNRYVGAMLASVSLLLSSQISKVYVPSGNHYGVLAPCGSHPLVDPLWSTEQLTIMHDGAEASRLDKLASFVGEPIPLRWLRVCLSRSADAYNCGRCEKCIRTMIGLNVTGLSESCATLLPSLDLEEVSRIRIRTNTRHEWEELASAVEESGTDTPLARTVQSLLRSAD